MLIIPAENAVNWKRPPWVTLGLIMACLLVFLFYQGGDSRKLEQAVEQYLGADLHQLEAPAYEDYLQRQIRFQGKAGRVHELQRFQQLREQNENVWLAINLMMDREFYQYLLQNQDVIWAPAERAYWQEQRLAIEQDYLQKLSANQLGLVPADLSLYTLITYQFLHGGWGHIIGNLIFLFLLGFTVEKALGPGRFLIAGAGLVWLLGKSWFQVREEFFEPEEEEQDARFTTGYAQAMASLGRMEFDLARRQFKALREHYPQRHILLEHLYQLAKLRPDLPAYRGRAKELMNDALSRQRKPGPSGGRCNRGD